MGGLLLVAAALKVHGLALDPFAEGSVLASARLQVATIEIEVLLGLWLLTGWSPRWAWVAALSLFSLFACVSLYLALAGQPSCSCFGRLAVSPWVSLGVDVAAVAALLIWRPPVGSEDIQTPVWARQLLKVGAGVCLVLAVASGAALLVFPTPAAALAWFRGEAVTVDPPVRDIGKGVRGEKQTFRVGLTNRTKQPIRVVGGTTTCACIATKDLPVALGPRETQTIEVTVQFAGSPGRFQRLFVLMTDAAKQPEVYARFSGEVLAPTEE